MKSKNFASSSILLKTGKKIIEERQKVAEYKKQIFRGVLVVQFRGGNHLP